MLRLVTENIKSIAKTMCWPTPLRTPSYPLASHDTTTRVNTNIGLCYFKVIGSGIKNASA